MKTLTFMALIFILALSVGCKKQDEIDALNAQVAALEAQVSTISGLQATIASLGTEVTSYQQMVDTLNASIATNNATIANLNGVIASLQADAVTNAAQIASLQSTVNSLTATNATLTSNLTNANNELAEVLAILAKYNVDLDQLRADYVGDIVAASHPGTFSYIGHSLTNPNIIVFQDIQYGSGYYGVDIEKANLLNYNGTGNIFQEGYYSQGVANADGTYTFTASAVNVNGTLVGGTGSWTFEETTINVKDIEKAKALREASKLEKVTNLLEMEYGFSESRAQEVTSVISNWKRISKTREMTKEEANMFAMEVTGSNVAQIEAAMVNSALGDNSLLNDLTQNAAELNGSSPEAIASLLNALN